MNSAISSTMIYNFMSQHVLAFPPPFSPSANGPWEGGLDTRGNRMGWPNLFRINKVSRGKKNPKKQKSQRTNRHLLQGLSQTHGHETSSMEMLHVLQTGQGEHGGSAGLEKIRTRFSGMEVSQLGLLWAQAAPRRPDVTGQGWDRATRHDTTKRDPGGVLKDGGDGRAGTPQRTGRAAAGREGSQAHRGSCHTIYAA